MIKSNKKLVNLLFLFFFLSIILLVNFLHTEKTINDNHFCPACHFQTSSQTTNTIDFFCPPQLCFLEILKTLEFFNYKSIFSIDIAPRAPPQS